MPGTFVIQPFPGQWLRELDLHPPPQAAEATMSEIHQDGGGRSKSASPSPAAGSSAEGGTPHPLSSEEAAHVTSQAPQRVLILGAGQSSRRIRDRPDDD